MPGQTIGVLALQGCVEPHIKMLESIATKAIEVRKAEELAQCDRLIMPGGESSTMLKFLEQSSLLEAIIDFGKTRPIWGVCAGAILLAVEVIEPKQNSLGLMNIRAIRNFYGSQLQSFQTVLNIPHINADIDVAFIRAPRLEALSPEVEVLASHRDDTVLLREGHFLASSFHSELGDDTRLHEYFLNLS